MTSRYSRPSEASALRKARIVNMTSLTGSLAGCALGHNKAALIWAGADGSHPLGSALPADSSAFYPASGETAPVGVLREVPARSVVAQGATGTSPARLDMSVAGQDPSQCRKRRKNNARHGDRGRRLADAREAAAAQAMQLSKEQAKTIKGDGSEDAGEVGGKAGASETKRRRNKAERLTDWVKLARLTPQELAEMNDYERGAQSAETAGFVADNDRNGPRGRAPLLRCNPMFGPALAELRVASSSSRLGGGGGSSSEDELWTLARRQDYVDV